MGALPNPWESRSCQDGDILFPRRWLAQPAGGSTRAPPVSVSTIADVFHGGTGAESATSWSSAFSGTRPTAGAAVLLPRRDTSASRRRFYTNLGGSLTANHRRRRDARRKRTVSNVRDRLRRDLGRKRGAFGRDFTDGSSGGLRRLGDRCPPDADADGIDGLHRTTASLVPQRPFDPGRPEGTRSSTRDIDGFGNVPATATTTTPAPARSSDFSGLPDRLQHGDRWWASEPTRTATGTVGINDFNLFPARLRGRHTRGRRGRFRVGPPTPEIEGAAPSLRCASTWSHRCASRHLGKRESPRRGTLASPADGALKRGSTRPDLETGDKPRWQGEGRR